MGDLPACKLCGCEPIRAKIHKVDIALHPDAACPLSGSKRMLPEQWNKLMGQGEAVAPVDIREMAFCEGVYAMAAEVKQLCKDFSDMQDRPYMGDVTAAVDGLAAQVAERPAPAVDDAVVREAVAERAPNAPGGINWLCDVLPERGAKLYLTPAVDDAVVRDAARYRFLAEPTRDMYSAFVESESKSELDAEIDAAMKEQSNENAG